MGAVCTDTRRFEEAKHYLLLGLKFLTAATDTAENAKAARSQVEKAKKKYKTIDATAENVVDDIMENINKDLDDWKFADLMKARTYGHMAKLCRAEGDLSGLVLYLNKAIDTMSDVENENELEVYAGELANELLQFFHQLGSIYRNQGLWSNVVTTYKAALETVKKHFGLNTVSSYLQRKETKQHFI